MAKRVDFYWKAGDLPKADGYKFVKDLLYGYLAKKQGEKEFNDLVFIIPVSELSGIIISDIKKEISKSKKEINKLSEDK